MAIPNLDMDNISSSEVAVVRGYKYILAATDSKCAKEIPGPKKLLEFVQIHIICMFRIPETTKQILESCSATHP